jgi:hypothetical protein
MLAGPNITSIVASDPKNEDAIFGDGDLITVLFSQETNRPSVSDRAQIDALFNFSAPLGLSYKGAWSSYTTLAITITTATGGNPEIGSFRIAVIGNLRNKDLSSLPSRAVSPVLTGNWGTKAGPAILSLVADDPDDGDGIYSDGDTVTVTFSEPTNAPDASNKAQLLALFDFSADLGTSLAGTWLANSSVLRITVVQATSVAPAVGSFFVKALVAGNIRNAASTSLPSTSQSPVLTGDWGLMPGPVILSVVADDPDDLDAVYSNGDVVIVSFNMPTNQPPLPTKAAVDALFSFSHPLGAAYTGLWSDDGRTLTINISNCAGTPPPVVGVWHLSAQPSGGLRDLTSKSLACSTSAVVLGGNWGLLAGPAISEVVASDPDNMDGIYSNNDVITIKFSTATNTPSVANKTALLAVFSFSQSLGTLFTGQWPTPDICEITIIDATGALPPKIGELLVSVRSTGSLKNSAGTSLPSVSVSAPIIGNWGTLPGPSIGTFFASDPDNGDAIFSTGDTLDISFSAATNAPALLLKAEIATVFEFSSPIGFSYSGEWLPGNTTFRIRILVAGTDKPVIGSVWAFIQPNQVVLRNAHSTSLPCVGSSAALSGNWGTLAGPLIVLLVADDEDDRDNIYGPGDTITVTFDKNTNTPPAATKAEIDALLGFTQDLGQNYIGRWLNKHTL